MKKLSILAAALFLCLSPLTSKADANAVTGFFDFPSDIIIGDTIDISTHIDFVFPDTGLFSEPILLTVYMVNETDTIQICEGSWEFEQPGTIIYNFSCAVPDDIDLGDYMIMIKITTALGEFVMVAPGYCRVNGTHDVNADGSFDIGDVVGMVDYMFNEGPAPQPGLSNADCNCDRNFDISDIITIADYVFNDGALPCFSGSK